jgi:hypothetical protein
MERSPRGSQLNTTRFSRRGTSDSPGPRQASRRTTRRQPARQYERYTSWGAENYTPRNVLDHLQREAFYGVGATYSVGSSPTEQAIQFQQDQDAGNIPLAARFFFMPGMAPPNGGPDAILIKATTALRVVHEVTTAPEARAAVQTMAGRNIKNVKIWVDDRRGTYPKMTPDVYNAIIDEAHRHRMKVHAHAIALADQKAVVRAGADVVVHTVTSEKLDDEYIALLREKRPYWTTVIGLGDRSEVCDNDPFVDQVLPSQVVATIRARVEARPLVPSCGPRSPNAAVREEMLANNFPKMIAAGARLVLGTDAGIHPGYTFGSAEHHEIARWVQSVTRSRAPIASSCEIGRPFSQADVADEASLISRAFSRTSFPKEISALRCSQDLRGFLDVAWRDPAERAVPAVGTDGVDCGHVDLRISQCADDVRDRADAIIALNQEASLRADHLPLVRLGDALERRHVGWDEIHLRATAFRESREREQIHAGVLQRAQGFRGFTGPVRYLHVKVVDLTNRVCHGVPPGASNVSTILPRSDDAICGDAPAVENPRSVLFEHRREKLSRAFRPGQVQ